MNNRNLPGERLAGLLADTLHKVQHGGITLDELALFNQRKNPFIREHIIDCDTDPFVSDGWFVEEHQQGGAFKWDKDAQKDALYLSKGQKNGKWIEGKKLRQELVNIPVLNANVLYYLLVNSHLIPEEWKGKSVSFWGTIYRDRDGFLLVRTLRWCGGRWLWIADRLDGQWGGLNPAAVSAPEVQQS